VDKEEEKNCGAGLEHVQSQESSCEGSVKEKHNGEFVRGHQERELQPQSRKRRRRGRKKKFDVAANGQSERKKKRGEKRFTTAKETGC